MQISNTKALAYGIHAAAGASRPKRFSLPSEWVLLVAMVTVCVLLASLEVSAAVMFDPNMLWMTPE